MHLPLTRTKKASEVGASQQHSKRSNVSSRAKFNSNSRAAIEHIMDLSTAKNNKQSRLGGANGAAKINSIKNDQGNLLFAGQKTTSSERFKHED